MENFLISDQEREMLERMRELNSPEFLEQERLKKEKDETDSKRIDIYDRATELIARAACISVIAEQLLFSEEGIPGGFHWFMADQSEYLDELKGIINEHLWIKEAAS